MITPNPATEGRGLDTEQRGAAALAYLEGFADYERTTAPPYTPRHYNLERVRLLCAYLGSPEARFRSLHIAGTKGKGSIAAMLDAILRAAGFRVGLFTSPHLHRFHERIRVGGEPISAADLADAVEHVRTAADRVHFERPDLGRLTTFELTTGAAFLHFANRRVDLAVLETGLGGRLDATNVVTPLVSVISSISLDHTRWLGDTIQLIAREKAGIVKPDVPVVAAPQRPAALAEIEAASRAQRAPLTLVGRDVRWHEYQTAEGWRLDVVPGDRSARRTTDDGRRTGSPGDAKTRRHGDTETRGEPSFLASPRPAPRSAGEPPRQDHDTRRTYEGLAVALFGAHQHLNAAVAVATVDVLQSLGIDVPVGAVQAGLATVRWPGRFELVSERPPIVVDGAHNVESASCLRAALAAYAPNDRITLIFGTSRDKDAAGILRAVRPVVGRLIVTRSQHSRSANPVELAALAKPLGLHAELAPDVPAALAAATSVVLKPPSSVFNPPSSGLICVTGSLFVVAEARAALGAPLEGW